MWLVLNDMCGLVCAIITYGIVTAVYVGFIRIGIWEGIQESDPVAFLHFVVFQSCCFMIFWSHFKCMTTEPGVLEKNAEVLEFQKLPSHLQNLVKAVGQRMK